MDVRMILLALELARVIAGETPADCPVEAKLAVAHVAHNRIEMGMVGELTEGWFGDAQPKPIDLAIAMFWNNYPDPTDGAVWMIGPGDNLPWLIRDNLTGRWECAGTWVETYKR